MKVSVKTVLLHLNCLVGRHLLRQNLLRCWIHVRSGNARLLLQGKVAAHPDHQQYDCYHLAKKATVHRDQTFRLTYKKGISEILRMTMTMTRMMLSIKSLVQW